MSRSDREHIVWSHPLLSLSDLIRRTRAGSQDCCTAANTVLYHKARAALWHGIRALELSSNASIAFPSLHCGIELDVLHDLGVTPCFYDVNQSLGVDMSSLGQAIDNKTEAVFITHYFGIVQNMEPVRTFCRDHGLRLIEDCAHTLPGLAGSLGDIAVFSLHKLLAVPDGGLLQINTDNLQAPSQPGPPPFRATREYLVRDLSRKIAHRSWHKTGWKFLQRLCLQPFYPGVTKFDAADKYLTDRSSTQHPLHMDSLEWGVAPLSRRLIRNSDINEITRRRLHNYRYLATHLSNSTAVQICVREIPDETCPMAFPVLVEQPREFMTFLLQAGVEIGPFWQSVHTDAEDNQQSHGARLASKLLTLPVHQQLHFADLEKTVLTVNNWSSSQPQ